MKLSNAKKLPFVLAYLFFHFTFPAFGQSRITIQNLDSLITCTGPEYLSSSGAGLALNEVKNIVFKDSSQLADIFYAPLNIKKQLWVKFNISNISSDSVLDCFVEVGWYDFITVYITDSLHTDSVEAGFFSKAAGRETYSYHSGFPLQLKPGESKLIYLKIRQWSRYFTKFTFGIGVYSLADYRNLIVKAFYDYKENIYSDLIFIGIFLFQVVYIFFQWVITRRMEYFYYTCYIGVVLIYFLARTLPNLEIPGVHGYYPFYMQYLNNVFIVLPYFFYYRFGRYFIDMKRRLPVINKWVIRIEYIIAAMIVIELISAVTEGMTWYRRNGPFIEIIFLFIVSSVFLFFLRRDKNTLTRFLVAGSFVALSGSLLGMFFPQVMALLNMKLDIAPLTVPKIAVMFEMIIFNTGLLFKAREIEKEKIKAQADLIAELSEKQKLLTKYQTVRDRIASDLHDDVGATLSSINIFSNLAHEKLLHEPRQAKELIEKINVTSQEMMNSMSDMVWAISPGNDKSESLSLRIKNLAREMLAPPEINYVVQSGDGQHKLSMEARRNIFLIVKEAINNIAKYSGAKNVMIKLEEHSGKLHLEINDDGIGFNPIASEERRGGAGLVNMRSRTEQLNGIFNIQSKPGAGTKIKALFDLDKINY